MQIEPRAVAVAALIASLTLAVTLWQVARGARHQQAARIWAIGFGTMNVGALLNIAQGDVSEWLSFVLGNSFMMLGVSLVTWGLRKVQRLETPLVLTLVVPCLLMAFVSTYWGVIAPNFTVRAAVYSLMMAVLSAYLAHSLRPLRKGPLQSAAWFVAVPALFLAVTMLVRSILSLTVGITPALQGGPFNTLTYLVGSSAFIAIEIGLILLHQLLLLDDVRKAAERDALTGVLNRRGLLATVPAKLAGYALLTMDVDFFKKVNDVSGHAAGDAVLACIGTLLRRVVREGDLAARMGGEEFCVLLKQSNGVVALQVAERLRADVALHSAAVPGGPVTMSLGISVAAQHDSFDTLARRSDAALYLAKKNGRNRCEVLE